MISIILHTPSYMHLRDTFQLLGYLNTVKEDQRIRKEDHCSFLVYFIRNPHDTVQVIDSLTSLCYTHFKVRKLSLFHEDSSLILCGVQFISYCWIVLPVVEKGVFSS